MPSLSPSLREVVKVPSHQGESALETLVVPVDLGNETPTNVQVWVADMDRLTALDGILSGWLAAEERERADRFHFVEHRRHFRRSRGVLRWLLGRWLRCDPGSIQFTYGSMGKPKLSSVGTHRVFFNLSHSGSLALYAISADREVGVDLEQIRPMPEAEAILGGFLSATAVARWARLPEDERAEDFFGHWVRREAILKWKGGGLAEHDGREVDLPNGCLEVRFRPAPGHLAVIVHGTVSDEVGRNAGGGGG